MSRSYKARNGRIIMRGRGGRFRKTTMQDIGVGGFCDDCGSMLLQHYDGDESLPFLDPRSFRYRCFTCEPRTDEEQAKHDDRVEAYNKKNRAFFDELERIVTEGD